MPVLLHRGQQDGARRGERPHVAVLPRRPGPRGSIRGGAVPDTCYGRTFRELSQAVPKARRGRISDACSESWQTAGMVWHGAYWTASLPEYQTGLRLDSRGRYRNAAGASSLSGVLEARAPQTYSLSAKACEGIIRRAEKRGKPLPEILKAALEWVIARDSAEETAKRQEE